MLKTEILLSLEKSAQKREAMLLKTNNAVSALRLSFCFASCKVYNILCLYIVGCIVLPQTHGISVPPGNVGMKTWNLSTCFRHKQLELVFLIDSRASVYRADDFNLVKKFAENIVKTLDVGKNHNKVAFLTYDRQVRSYLNFTQCNMTSCAIEAIKQVDPKSSTSSGLAPALSYVQTIFLNESERNRRKRLKIPFAVIVFVAESSSDDHKALISFIRSSGVRTIVIGYNKDNDTLLTSTTGFPYADSFIFNASYFLPSEGSATVSSLLCEETSNFDMSARERSQPNNTLQYIRPVLTDVFSTSTSITLSWTLPSFSLLSYRLSVAPNHGIVLVTNTTAVITDLVQFSFYKIKVTPESENGTELDPSVFIISTAPEPIRNLSMKTKPVNTSYLQKELKEEIETYMTSLVNPESEVTLLVVEWNTNSDNSFYEVAVVPSAPELLSQARKSNRRLFIGKTPGTQYKAYVTARIPRQSHRGVIWSTSTIVPPASPSQLSIKQWNTSTATMEWKPPKEGVYDSFFIVFRYAFGENFYNFELPLQISSSNTSSDFFNFTVYNLLPDMLYHIKVYTRSHGVLSDAHIWATYLSKKDKVKEDLKENLSNSLLISASDGVYAMSLKAFEFDSSSSQDTTDATTNPEIQRIISAPNGAVNAIYDRRVNNIKAESKKSPKWREYVVWIDRNDHVIRKTEIPEFKTTTLLSGLLQPVGLAIDKVDGNLYWSDVGAKSIGVLHLDFSKLNNSSSLKVNRRLIYGDGMQTPISVAIDPIRRRLFWADLTGRIEMSAMNGFNREVLVRDATLRPYALTYCLDSRRLYWVNSKSDALEAYLFDSLQRKVILQPATGSITGIPLLTSYQTDLFWSNSDWLLLIKMNGMNSSKRLSLSASIPVTYLVGLNDVTTISAYDDMTYQKAILRQTQPLQLPCYHGNDNCYDVCISTSLNETSCTDHCLPWEMVCNNSINRPCVSTLLTCDGHQDCPNGEDENLPECSERGVCSNNNLTGNFICKSSGRCILSSLLCNGQYDCRDGSDEKDCAIQNQKCNFENGLCLWSQNKNDDFDWLMRHGRTPSKFTGPIHDHTLLDSNSSYLYIEATNQDTGANAVLTSPWLTSPVCVTFFYNMFGAGMGALYLKSQHLGQSVPTVVWDKSKNQGPFWRKASVSVDEYGLYKVMFEAVRGYDYRSDIALDDVSIADGLCDVGHKCSFEKTDDNLCGFKQTNKHWKVHFSSKEDDKDFFSNLHNLNDTIKPLDANPLESLGPEWFYYDFKVENKPGCSECNGTKLVRKVSSFETPRFAGLVICDATKYKIYLSDGLQDVFLNVADGQGKGEDHCEFIGSKGYASELGEYKNCEGAVAYARRRRGESVEKRSFGYLKTDYFSPSYYRCDVRIPQVVLDNDLQTRNSKLPNRFLILENGVAKSDDFIKLIIPVSLSVNDPTYNEYSTTKAPSSATASSSNSHSIFMSVVSNDVKSTFSRWCLSFRYFMHNSDTEILQVSINNTYIVWSKMGDQRTEWNSVIINIPVPVVKYDLVFSARSGDGKIGVDDVIISHSPCFLPQHYTCNFDKIISEECAFVIKPDNVDYVKVKELYKRQHFDPLIVDNRPKPAGLIGYFKNNLKNPPVIMTPVLPRLSPFYPNYCLAVHYRQQSNSGVLEVVIRSVVNNNKIVLSQYELESINLVTPWLVLQTEVNASTPLASSHSFVLEFHGLQYVWLDKISLETRSCTSGAQSVCNNGIMCENMNCVNPRRLCDGFNDCGDWSDEIGCSSGCGSNADVLGSEGHLHIAPTFTRFFESQICTWRIHGAENKNILLEIEREAYNRLFERFNLTVYDSFASRKFFLDDSGLPFASDSRVLFKNSFHNSTQYVFDSRQLTIIVQHTTVLSMKTSLVDKDYCNYVCSDNFCVTSNFECDGIAGCPNGDDESNCTRVNENLGAKIFEVRRTNSDYSYICADDVTYDVADAACKQMGFLKPKRPLRFISLPVSGKFITSHRLKENVTIGYPPFLQGHLLAPALETKPEKTKSTKELSLCPSNRAWIADCIPYQCGIRSVQPRSKPVLRIVGGRAPRKGMWPWVVSLQVENIHLCGGTLITDRLVLTAAHCFDKEPPIRFKVIAGATDLDPLDKEAQIFSIKKGTLHENYDKNKEIPDWDIALLELDKPIKFTPYVGTACIPDGNIQFLPGKRCYIVGYGHLIAYGSDPYFLHEAATPILTDQECSSPNYYYTKITSRMLCTGYPKTGGIGICHGDSGGPLLCQADNKKWMLAGVASWSIGCADRRKPDVFSDIQYFMEWIKEKSGLNLTIPDHARPGTCGGTFPQRKGWISSPGWPDPYLNNRNCTYRILAGPGETIHFRVEYFDTETNHDAIILYKYGMHEFNELAILSGYYKDTSGLKYEVKDGNLEVLFHSGRANANRGFHATWNITGSKRNFADAVEPLTLSLTRGSYNSGISVLVQRFLGDYYPVTPVIGTRPMYLQEGNNSSTSKFSSRHKIFYSETKGQWLIRRQDDVGNYIYSNDSSAYPYKVLASWELKTNMSLSNTTLPLKFSFAIPETTTPDPTTSTSTESIRSYTPAPPAQCYFKLSNKSGSISSQNVPQQSSSNCRWHLTSNHSQMSTMWILIQIEYFNTTNIIGIFEGTNTSTQPLYVLNRSRNLDFYETEDQQNQSDSITNVTEYKNTVLFYRDLNAQGLSLVYFTNQSHKNDSGFYLTYEFVSEVNNATFDLNTHTMIELKRPRLQKRSIDNSNSILSSSTVSPLLSLLSSMTTDSLKTDASAIPTPGTHAAETNNKSTTAVSVDTLPSISDVTTMSTLVKSTTSITTKYSTSAADNLTLETPSASTIFTSSAVTAAVNTTPSLHTTIASSVSSNHTEFPSSIDNQPSITVEFNCNNTTMPLNKLSSEWSIISPGYPYRYPASQNCTWRFQTKLGYKLHVTFTDLHLEAGACNYDYVELFDGLSSKSPSLGIFCGSNVAPNSSYLSNGSEMTIKFISDIMFQQKGFRAIITAKLAPVLSSPFLFSCNFTGGLCGFAHQTRLSSFRWIHRANKTPSSNTGPDYDDSPDGTGWYLYIEASSPRLRGDRARIITPKLRSRPDQPVCLTFSYDMFGRTVGFLNVYAVISLLRNRSRPTFEKDSTESVSSTKPLVHLYGLGVGSEDSDTNNKNISTQSFLLWSKYGQQRGRFKKPWSTASITFYPFNDFQIVFEGIRGRDFDADIAIDNVMIKEGECDEICDADDGHFSCSDVSSNNNECIPSELRCDGRADCSDGNDEEECSALFRKLCKLDNTFLPNSTEAMICSPQIVDRCSFQSSSFTGINNIICDGIYDCFGGYDESQCNNVTKQGSNPAVVQLTPNCGRQSENNFPNDLSGYPSVSSSDMWPWVAGLYVATPPLDGGTESANLTGHTFLCSATFLRSEWALVPAHCLLNPDKYTKYANDVFETHQSDTAMPDGLSDEEKQIEEEALMEETDKDIPFSYTIINSKDSANNSHRFAWKVTNWVIHPKYLGLPQADDPSRFNNDLQFKAQMSQFENLLSDVDKVNFDLALLKVERHDDILADDFAPNPINNEEILPPIGDYILYDSLSTLNATEEQIPALACLEVFDRNGEKRTVRGNKKHQDTDGGAFKLPLEGQRIGNDKIKNTQYPSRADCYVVGHSPVSLSSKDGAEDDLVWGLRSYLSPVTSADQTDKKLFCDLFSDSSIRDKCSNSISGISQKPSIQLRTLMRTGYQSKRAVGLLQDPGSVVFCKNFKDQWYLTGIYNWINLQRNFITKDFAELINNAYSQRTIPFNSLLGIPMGTDYYTKLTPSLNDWVIDTLLDPCPAQFSCYPFDSSKHQCISKDKVCDGKIDCQENYADEKKCSPGCYYDPEYDPFYQYYLRLQRAGVKLPKTVLVLNLSNSMTKDEMKYSWKNDSSPGVKMIRFNKLDGQTIRSCRWTIKPPKGKVAVIRVPKMSTNPVLNGGAIQIVSGTKITTTDWSVGPHYYTSLPGQPITFMLVPSHDDIHLTKIRNRHFNYYIEDVGNCSEQHKCGDGTCISPLKVCDGNLDCKDLSDEIHCPSGCEGRSLYVGVSNGTLLSRHYPLPITGNGDCLWMILADYNQSLPIQHHITIRFTDFVTSPLDELFIYSGVGRSKELYSMYSVGPTSFNITLPLNQVTIVLRSNDGIAKRRIKGQFEVIPITENAG